MSFHVLFSEGADEDLIRLYEYRLYRAASLEELTQAPIVIDDLRYAISIQLSRNPLIFRKAADDPFTRELVIPAGNSGDIALFHVFPSEERVVILAVRHQREVNYR